MLSNFTLDTDVEDEIIVIGIGRNDWHWLNDGGNGIVKIENYSSFFLLLRRYFSCLTYLRLSFDFLLISTLGNCKSLIIDLDFSQGNRRIILRVNNRIHILFWEFFQFNKIPSFSVFSIINLFFLKNERIRSEVNFNSKKIEFILCFLYFKNFQLF